MKDAADEASKLSAELSKLNVGEKGGTVFVDDEDCLRLCVKSLSACTEVAVDCEGVDLGRTGALTILTLSDALDAGAAVYVVDVQVLGGDRVFCKDPQCTDKDKSLPSSEKEKEAENLKEKTTVFAIGAGAGREETLADKDKKNVGSSSDKADTTSFLSLPEIEKEKPSLRGLLENESIKLITFDCRSDSDALYHQFGISLSGVIDLQVSVCLASGLG